MVKFHWKFITCVIAAGLFAGLTVSAKDEHKHGNQHKPAHHAAPAHQPAPVQHHAPAVQAPRVQQPIQLPPVQHQPVQQPVQHQRHEPRHEPVRHQPVQVLPQVTNQVTNSVPAVQQHNIPKVHVAPHQPREHHKPDIGAQNQPQLQFVQQNNQVPRNKVHEPPKIHVPGNASGNQPSQPRVIVPQPSGPQNPPQIPNLPLNQPKIEVHKPHQPRVNLPPNSSPGAGSSPGTGSSNPQLPPNLPLQQNPVLPGNQQQHDARKTHQPRVNLPPNTVPGTGAGGPGAGGPGAGAGNLPGSQPKVILPGQQDHLKGRTGGGLPVPDPSRLPQFKPNTNPVDPKVGPNHNPGLKLDNGQGNLANPGLGNRHHQPHERLPMKIDNPIAGEHRQAIPLTIPKNGGHDQFKGRDLPGDKGDKGRDQLQTLLRSRDHGDLKNNLEHWRQSPDFAKHPQLSHVNLDHISGLHQDRLRNENSFEHWRHGNVGQQLNIDRQLQLQRHGDITRQMNFTTNVINAGGWQHRHHGAVAAAFTAGSFSVWYAGGGCYPSHCWYPKWSPWVNWCWWDSCLPFYDPRPIYCRPIVYQPCQPWVAYQYPVWQPLPVVACGTWIDVQPAVIQAGLDLQLLAVRFVDNGHPEQNLGPRYRVWVRNNSQVQITNPFSVLVLADNDTVPNAGVPQAGVVIPSMDIGEIKPVDIRLPLEANRIGTTPEGYKVPFAYLHVLVDSHQQIAETDEANNGSVVARTEILPVDPAAFSTDQTAAAPGGTLTIAGEGFGPEPGRVLVSVNGQNTEALIQGWYDLGIRFTVPTYTLTGTVEAEVLVVRGDGAVSNPLDIQLAPQTLLGPATDIPLAPLPEPPQ